MHTDTNDDSQESEIVYINPRKDVWLYHVPLDHTTENQTKDYKKLAAEALAKKIIDQIEPEYFEMNGFELMKYCVIVKKHD